MTATAVRGIGVPVKRKEDPRFIRGKGTYVDDVKLPGMLYMDIVRSPYAHARIKRIDVSKARAMPGVIDVITGERVGQGQSRVDAHAHGRPTNGLAD